MKILDLSAGRRAIWFNKNHPLATLGQAPLIKLHEAASDKLGSLDLI